METYLNLRFPEKLWKIINCCKTDSIIWSQDGESILLRYAGFEKEFMAEGRGFFKTTKISSFVRQLNLYGFVKVRVKNRGKSQLHEFRHRYFQRDYQELLQYVSRNLKEIDIDDDYRRCDKKRNKRNAKAAVKTSRRRKPRHRASPEEKPPDYQNDNPPAILAWPQHTEEFDLVSYIVDDDGAEKNPKLETTLLELERSQESIEDEELDAPGQIKSPISADWNAEFITALQPCVNGTTNGIDSGNKGIVSDVLRREMDFLPKSFGLEDDQILPRSSRQIFVNSTPVPNGLRKSSSPQAFSDELSGTFSPIVKKQRSISHEFPRNDAVFSTPVMNGIQRIRSNKENIDDIIDSDLSHFERNYSSNLLSNSRQHFVTSTPLLNGMQKTFNNKDADRERFDACYSPIITSCPGSSDASRQNVAESTSMLRLNGQTRTFINKGSFGNRQNECFTPSANINFPRTFINTQKSQGFSSPLAHITNVEMKAPLPPVAITPKHLGIRLTKNAGASQSPYTVKKAYFANNTNCAISRQPTITSSMGCCDNADVASTPSTPKFTPRNFWDDLLKSAAINKINRSLASLSSPEDVEHSPIIPRSNIVMIKEANRNDSAHDQDDNIEKDKPIDIFDEKFLQSTSECNAADKAKPPLFSLEGTNASSTASPWQNKETDIASLAKAQNAKEGLASEYSPEMNGYGEHTVNSGNTTYVSCLEKSANIANEMVTHMNNSMRRQMEGRTNGIQLKTQGLASEYSTEMNGYGDHTVNCGNSTYASRLEKSANIANEMLNHMNNSMRRQIEGRTNGIQQKTQYGRISTSLKNDINGDNCISTLDYEMYSSTAETEAKENNVPQCQISALSVNGNNRGRGNSRRKRRGGRSAAVSKNDKRSKNSGQSGCRPYDYNSLPSSSNAKAKRGRKKVKYYEDDSSDDDSETAKDEYGECDTTTYARSKRKRNKTATKKRKNQRKKQKGDYDATYYPSGAVALPTVCAIGGLVDHSHYCRSEPDPIEGVMYRVLRSGRKIPIVIPLLPQRTNKKKQKPQNKGEQPAENRLEEIETSHPAEDRKTEEGCFAKKPGIFIGPEQQALPFEKETLPSKAPTSAEEIQQGASPQTPEKFLKEFLMPFEESLAKKSISERPESSTISIGNPATPIIDTLRSPDLSFDSSFERSIFDESFVNEVSGITNINGNKTMVY